jgi:hypothetical protein
MIFTNLTWQETKREYSNWFNWEQGRKKTYYSKLTIFANPFLIPWHILILKFPEGSNIPEHKDPMKGRRHWRLNIIVKSAKEGGEFICENPIIQSRFLNFFRSDINKHRVTKVVSGTRYVLSIGWMLKATNSEPSS